MVESTFGVEEYPLTGIFVAYERIHSGKEFHTKGYLHRDERTGIIHLRPGLSPNKPEEFDSAYAANAFITEYLKQRADPPTIKRLHPYEPEPPKAVAPDPPIWNEVPLLLDGVGICMLKVPHSTPIKEIHRALMKIGKHLEKDYGTL